MALNDQMMLTAMQSLTDQLKKLNTFYSTEVNQTERDKAQAHSDEIVAKASSPFQPQSYGPSVDEALRNSQSQSQSSNAPDAYTYTSAYRTAYQNSTGGIARRALGSLGVSAQAMDYQQTAAQKQQRASASAQAALGGVGGSGLPIPQSAGHGMAGMMFGSGQGNQDNMMQTAVTMAMLGEHGGPAFARNAYMEGFALQQQLRWAQNAAHGLSGGMQQGSTIGRLAGAIPGINQSSMNTISGAMGLALDHPWAAYGIYKAGTGLGHLVGRINDSVSSMQNAGTALGLSGNASGGQYFFGHRNLASVTGPATGVGAGAKLAELMAEGKIPGSGFGRGLSHEQATSDVQNIMSQGFGANETTSGGGDITTLLQGLYRPLQQGMSGLSAGDIGQFVPALRNSNDSIAQLRDTLSGLGEAAQASHETVSEFSSSLASAGRSFESMGSSFKGGIGVGMGFTAATGLDPQLASQIAQNPMFQGMAMGQYGVLPSGVGDLNPGAFNSTAMSTMQMLQRGLSGINRDRYTTMNGQRVLVASGKGQMYDQIAKMMGIPSSVVQRMLGDQSGINARDTLQQGLGDSGQSTGFYQLLNGAGGGKLNDQQYKMAENYWNKAIAPNWKGSGIGQKEMTRLSHITGMRDRAKALQTDITRASKKDTANQIQGNPNSQTVQVKFTGLAAKFFQQAGPTSAKKAANAGGSSIAGIMNSITGDISGSPLAAPFDAALGPVEAAWGGITGGPSGAISSLGNTASNLASDLTGGIL